MKLLPLAVVALSITSAATGAFAAPFTNGSFEGTAPIGNIGFLNLTAGSTLIPGWTVVTDIDWLTTWIAPADGLRSIDLNGYGPGGIQQTFDTIPGQQYLVRFALAGNVVDYPPLKVGQVSAAGQSMQFQFNTTGHTASSPGYVDTDFNFTANSSSTTLVFTSLLQNSAGGAVIDNVRVTAVPEPAGLSVMSLVAVAILRRPKRT